MKYENNNSNPRNRRSFLKTIGALIFGGAAYETYRRGSFDSSVEYLKEQADKITENFSEKPLTPEQERLNKLYEILIRDWPKPEEEKNDSEKFERREEAAHAYKKQNTDFDYLDDLSEPKIKGTKLFEDIGNFGSKSWGIRFIQTLRFQPITMAVERKYNLPRNLLLAMILQESSGEEYLPNAKDDGGFGLVHMQSGTAKEFGVPVYKDCPAIVCDGEDKRSCVDESGQKISHAKELRQIMEVNLDNRAEVAKVDGRLHHVENVDAAGRMLSFHIARYPDTLKTLPDDLKKMGPLRAAICKYSGPKNFPEYWERVRTFMALLSNEDFLNNLFQKMEKEKGSAQINEQDFGYLNYIRSWQDFFALNYGLEEYVQTDCYTTSYSEAILKSYRGVLPEIDESTIARFSK